METLDLLYVIPIVIWVGGIVFGHRRGWRGPATRGVPDAVVTRLNWFIGGCGVALIVAFAISQDGVFAVVFGAVWLAILAAGVLMIRRDAR